MISIDNRTWRTTRHALTRPPQSLVCTEDRLRILRLIVNLCLGNAAVGYLTESMHGAGSSQAQLIMISRLVNHQENQKAAKMLCGIADAP